MAEPDKPPVTMEELLVSSLAETDATMASLTKNACLSAGQLVKLLEDHTLGTDVTSLLV